MKIATSIWNGIRARKSLDAYLTICVALVVTILGVFGVVNQTIISSAILAILALVSFNLLQHRHDDDEIRGALARIGVPHNLAQLFLRHEFDPYRLKDAIRNSQRAFFWGVTLTTTIQVLDNAIEQGLKSGLDVRFLLVKPNSPSIEMTAFRNSYRRSLSEVDLALTQTLRRLAIIAQEASGSGKLEVRVVNYLPPYIILAADPHLPIGRMSVYLTAFRTPKETRPGFDLTSASDGEWFNFFVKQFEDVWKNSEQLNLEAYLIHA